MTVVVDDTDFTLYLGDVCHVLAQLPDESVHCVVTSPPYWGLRDYGTGVWDGGNPNCDHVRTTLHQDRDSDRPQGWDGNFRNTGTPRPIGYGDVCGKCGARRVDQQLGLEPTPDQYVTNMVAVFREIRRVLRRDGTCWLNIGDSYATQRNDHEGGGFAMEKGNRPGTAPKRGWHGGPDLKPKDLCGIPWRLAFALQTDGWYLRADIIWAKPNPMPESVTDRPTKAHEYVFLLSRSPRYFFDQEAVREAYTPDDRLKRVHDHSVNGSHENHATMTDGRERWAHGGRNVRSVWEIATQPYAEAHFATFPEALVERCVLAGTSERGCCPECGAPWERETERAPNADGIMGRGNGRHLHDFNAAATGKHLDVVAPRTIGWRPTCHCFAGIDEEEGCYLRPPVPCTVLDPFMGSGTTALVARRLGRQTIGVELNPTYAELAARRLQQLSLLAPTGRGD